ncbi:MAG: hypothetical protein AMJ92_03745 [candidate division Zixibacteria bacterium SM23_81]|nr:MAG: hypothetical protein AMJ92_03745 [candidate division Zixibacteria bacterium SM23_81]
MEILHRQVLPHVFQNTAGDAWRKVHFTSILADENAALLVAECEGHIMGFVHVLIPEASDIPIMVPRRYAVVDNLVVRKRFRRHGVGRSLMEHAHRWALDKKVRHVKLNVCDFNKEAFAFYKKLGYQTASRKMWKPLEQHVSDRIGRR